MFADRALLEGMAAPVTLVSWRSHRVKRVVTSASAAEAMGLSETIAQGHWVRALWSEVVLGLNQRAITTIYTTRQSAPVRTEGVLLIWQSSEKTCPDHRCSCGGSMERRKWPTPWLSFMVMEIRRTQPSSIHSVGRGTRDYGCQTSRERERVPRVKSPSKLRELVDEMSMPVTTTTTVT